MSTLETITRRDLIEWVALLQTNNNKELTERFANRLSREMDNQSLCDYCLKQFGLLVVPRTSNILEFLN